MRRKDKTEQARAELLKSVRTAIRLKHALAADRELNEVLPKAEALFEARVAEGLSYQLDPKTFLALLAESSNG